MPFFIHHVNNPYLYNPAFAGYEKHAVIFLTHREQWIGIEGAPSTSNLSFHTPAGNSNPFSLGADITNDRIGILNNTTLRATFGYLVPFGIKREHYLRFGLAGGLSSQQFDLKDINIEDDLALHNILKRSSFMDGRFGIQYHIENFNLGFTLPHIFSNPMMSPDGLKAVQLSALDRFIVSANYRINLNVTGNLAFEPTVLYNISRELENQLEAFGVLQVKDAFWVGGGYQQQSGIAGLLGFKIKGLKIGYAYGVGGNPLAGQSGGIHEAQIALLMGKKQEVMKRKPRLSTTTNGDRIPEAVIAAAKKAKEEKQKKKEETIPDRKKAYVTVTQDSTKTTENTSSQENNGIILIPSNEKQAEKTSTEPENTSKTATPKKEVNYDQLAFESLDENKNKTVQLGEGTQSNTISRADNNSKKMDQTPAPEKQTENKQPKEEAPAKPVAKLVKVAPSKITDHPLALKEGKYIVAGTFSQEDNAHKMIQKLRAEGHNANLGYHTEKKFYYVHVMSSNDVEVLKAKLQDLRNSPFFENAWILSVEE